MIVLSDTAFHAAEGDPSDLKLCPRGEWQDRLLVESVLSMLTLVCHLKKVMHRGWAKYQYRCLVCQRLTPLVNSRFSVGRFVE